MTTQEFINSQKRRIGNVVTCFESAVVSTHSVQTQRIFGQGLDANGSPIGQYNSTDELYVNPKDAPKSFTPEGKYGDRTFQNGKQHKTKYFSSYKSFRSNQGRRDDVVNLNLSGLLFKDFASTVVPQGNRVLTGVRNAANVGKVDGAINKYGEVVFKLSENELNTLTENSLKCWRA